MSSTDTVRELADLIFEMGEKLPDADYKKALDLCGEINRTRTVQEVDDVYCRGGCRVWWRELMVLHEQMNQLRQLNENLELRAIRAHQRLETEKADAKTAIAALEKRVASLADIVRNSFPVSTVVE